MPFLPTLPRTRAARAAISLALAATVLVACGGGDDAPTPVDPPVTPSNLADCHNPSMYIVGSSWSTTFSESGPVFRPDQAPEQATWENTYNTWVLEPPAAWGLPVGTVRHSGWPAQVSGFINDIGGTYVRAHENTIEVLLLANWQHFSSGEHISYSGYVPGLVEPIALTNGQTYQGTPVSVYGGMFAPRIDAVGNAHYPDPPLGDERYLRPEKTSIELTYVGRETITVPAGTFSTCHVMSRERPGDGQPGGDVPHEEWRVAEGPYKGISIKTRRSGASGSTVGEAKQISADWK